MFMGASTKQGYEIAEKSRKIVRELIEDQTKNLNKEEKSIIERIVHSTADPEYANLVKFSSDFIESSLKGLNNDLGILTDINMVKSGINKNKTSVDCYINTDEVIKIAKEREITRSAAAVEYAAENGFNGIICIGNAPTALYKAMELIDDGKLNVQSIIGVPVGFVGAAESKEKLSETNISYLITKGPKGGTPVAVATMNSLIRISNDWSEN